MSEWVWIRIGSICNLELRISKSVISQCLMEIQRDLFVHYLFVHYGQYVQMYVWILYSASPLNRFQENSPSPIKMQNGQANCDTKLKFGTYIRT